VTTKEKMSERKMVYLLVPLLELRMGMWNGKMMGGESELQKVGVMAWRIRLDAMNEPQTEI